MNKIDGGYYDWKTTIIVALLIFTVVFLTVYLFPLTPDRTYSPVYMDDIVTAGCPTNYDDPYIILFWIFIYLLFITVLVLVIWYEGYKEGRKSIKYEAR